MKRYLILNVVCLITAAAVILLILELTRNTTVPKEWNLFAPPTPTPAPHLDITSIDTMKYSRDKSREIENNPSFDKVIDTQMQNIAKTKAKYVAIGTPYDEEFVPVLARWLSAARKYKLHVWFRGNFSGWEGWFGYSRISREDHQRLLEQFLLNHSDLFANGDIFTPCPECENGGPGDPRNTGDVAGFRDFMVKEHRLSDGIFTQLNKKVQTNLASMNYDVASLVMDKKTTQSMNGVVTVDHYVKDPIKLASDLDTLAQKTGGKVVLGEFGAPIPDIHGSMTEDQQAEWVRQVMEKVSHSYGVIGVNYWVSVGGSTQIWDENGTSKPAVAVLTNYFGHYNH